MSSKITNKLCSHIRDPARAFLLSQSLPLRKPSGTRFAFSDTSRRAFSWSRPRLQGGLSRGTPDTRTISPSHILFFDAKPAVTTSSTVTSCTTTSQKSLHTTTTLHRSRVISLAQQTLRREIHSSSRRRQKGIARRNKSSTSNEQNGRKPPHDGTPKAAPVAKKTESPAPESTSSNSYLHLPQMPKMPHRPTKEELLAAATGFWSRLKVRFKWFSIRSVRPWNVDDWSAFVSWFVLGNIVWIFIGTTTFFSLVIFSINTVVAQGTFY
jgi:distribution and morphology protein 31